MSESKNSDPYMLRAYANTLRHDGYPVSAGAMDAAAERIENAEAENAKLREACDCVGRHKLEQEIERLRAELAALRATAPYRVESQQPATVEQGEWMVVELECPE